ncbi:MAG: hypothetical protein RSE37_23080, partial [Citrobacter sp.]
MEQIRNGASIASCGGHHVWCPYRVRHVSNLQCGKNRKVGNIWSKSATGRALQVVADTMYGVPTGYGTFPILQ